MKKSRLSLVACSLFLSAFAGGCSSTSTNQANAGNSDDAGHENGDASQDEIPTAQSSLARDTSPNVPAADAEALREGNTAFAADVYATLAKGDLSGKNIFFSPHSITTAIAMNYAGARGATESQIAKALHFTLPQDKLHPALNALNLALEHPKSASSDDGGTPFQLNVVNSTWAEKNFTFVPAYLDTLAKNYGAGVRLADFKGDAEGSRKTINGWVEDQTNQKIKGLLGEGSITRETLLVLVNAVYFHAGWTQPFEESATKSAVFHGVSGDKDVPTMHGKQRYARYAEGEGWKAVECSFSGGDVTFDVVVPDTIDAFETSFDASKIKAITDAFSTYDVDLALPKFEIPGASFSLKKVLQARGMIDAFENSADYSGISSLPTLVDEVLHQAFVSVGEKGVEAAAATAVISGPSSVPQNKTLNVDKPFVFFIRDQKTGALLFLGRVLDLGT